MAAGSHIPLGFLLKLKLVFSKNMVAPAALWRGGAFTFCHTVPYGLGVRAASFLAEGFRASRG